MIGERVAPVSFLSPISFSTDETNREKNYLSSRYSPSHSRPTIALPSFHLTIKYRNKYPNNQPAVTHRFRSFPLLLPYLYPYSRCYRDEARFVADDGCWQSYQIKFRNIVGRIQSLLRIIATLIRNVSFS